MPVGLLGVSLPIMGPAQTAAYSKEFDRAFNAVRLGRGWYYCIERNLVLRPENLNLYRQFLPSTELELDTRPSRPVGPIDTHQPLITGTLRPEG